MKIINHNGDSVRQIVPQDLSYLSDADQQIAAAIGGVLGKMFGLTSGMAVVMKGMNRSLVIQQAPLTGSILTIDAGEVYYDGKLYSFGGGTVVNTGLFSESFSSRFCLKFTDTDTVAPSPVYGATIAQNVIVHKSLKAVLAKTSDMTENDSYVTLGNVKVIPQLASANSITASLLTYSGTEQ